MDSMTRTSRYPSRSTGLRAFDFRPVETWLCHDPRGAWLLASNRPELDGIPWTFSSSTTLLPLSKQDAATLLDQAGLPALPVNAAVNLTTGEIL